jgi:hypothetical protein
MEEDEMSGIDKALEAAGGGTLSPDSYKKIAELLGTSTEFIYNCRRKGWFPPERARVVANAYGVPLADLVSPTNRALLNAQ